MLVGYVDIAKKPRKLVKITAMLAPQYGLEIIYFKPNDVNTKDGTVHGKMYINNRWRSVKKTLPTILDTTVRCYRKDYRKAMNYLRKNAILTFDKAKTPNKEKLQEELDRDPELSHLIIPTKRLNSFNCITDFLEKHSSIILKPIYGSQGRGIYSLSLNNTNYLLAYNDVEKVMELNELKKFYQNMLTDRKYIIQKKIDSTTHKNIPFDCRIVTQKNGKGQWIIAKKYFRLGIGNKVVSNIAQGGGISDPRPLLRSTFPEMWRNILSEIKKKSIKISYKFEEIKQTPTMDLGIDLGIDKDGQLYLFEVNNGAGLKRLRVESAMLRLSYYQYLIKQNKELYNSDRSIKFKTVNDIKQENSYYKKELKKIRKSRSWRITLPLRKISEIFKRR